MAENEVLIEGNICKSITGQEDENGNFIDYENDEM